MKNTRTFSKKQHKYKYSKNINTKKKRITKKNIYKRKRYKHKVYGGDPNQITQAVQAVQTDTKNPSAQQSQAVEPDTKNPSAQQSQAVEPDTKDPKTTTQYIIFQIPDLYASDISNKLKYFINITHTDLNKIENVDDLLYILKKSRNELKLDTDVKIEEAVTEHNTKSDTKSDTKLLQNDTNSK